MSNKYIKIFENLQKDLKVIRNIKEDYFISNIIDIDINQRDGYVKKENKMVFGSSYGINDIDCYYLMHEMGHFITIKKYERLLLSTYGMSYTTKDIVNDVEYDLPMTWNAIKNELKAVAFQEILSIKYTGKFPLDKWLLSFNLMDDFINVPLWNAYKDSEYNWFDNETKEKIHYKEYENRKIDTIYNFYNKWKKDNSSILNIEYFNNEWFKRVKYIETHIQINNEYINESLSSNFYNLFGDLLVYVYDTEYSGDEYLVYYRTENGDKDIYRGTAKDIQDDFIRSSKTFTETTNNIKSSVETSKINTKNIKPNKVEYFNIVFYIGKKKIETIQYKIHKAHAYALKNYYQKKSKYRNGIVKLEPNKNT